ncbi:MAG TPA: hypothetical protein VLS93_15715 [Anaeromyxobacteraceae bacterium]|nr:hypothetical protein [Anaeromyxobacteraceae bacterium]
MSLDLRRSGEALLATSGELLRIWRAARAEVRPGVFPGLADGLVAAVLERAAQRLSAGGGDAADPYRGAVALVRADPRVPAISAEEIETEWRVLAAVLRAVCDALDVEEEPRAFLARVVEVARADAEALAHGRGPAGVLVVGQLSGFEPPRKKRD